jgi:hypothetical protein
VRKSRDSTIFKVIRRRSQNEAIWTHRYVPIPQLAYLQASKNQPRPDQRKSLNSAESATSTSTQSLQSNPHQTMINLPTSKRKEQKEKAGLATKTHRQIRMVNIPRQKRRDNILQVEEAVPASVAAKSQQKPQAPQKSKELPPRDRPSVSSIK